jgi:hypothetical protein
VPSPVTTLPSALSALAVRRSPFAVRRSPTFGPTAPCRIPPRFRWAWATTTAPSHPPRSASLGGRRPLPLWRPWWACFARPRWACVIVQFECLSLLRAAKVEDLESLWGLSLSAVYPHSLLHPYSLLHPHSLLRCEGGRLAVPRRRLRGQRPGAGCAARHRAE